MGRLMSMSCYLLKTLLFLYYAGACVLGGAEAFTASNRVDSSYLTAGSSKLHTKALNHQRFSILSSSSSSSSSSTSSSLQSSSTAVTEFADGTVRDSWAVITLGDLHMEDDMSNHEQARQDCIEALKKLSILVEHSMVSSSSSQSIMNGNGMDMTTSKDDNDDDKTRELPTLKQVVEELQDIPAKDLTAEQLDLLLTQKQQGSMCHSYLVSLGDLGRKE